MSNSILAGSLLFKKKLFMLCRESGVIEEIKSPAPINIRSETTNHEAEMYEVLF